MVPAELPADLPDLLRQLHSLAGSSKTWTGAPSTASASPPPAAAWISRSCRSLPAVGTKIPATPSASSPTRGANRLARQRSASDPNVLSTTTAALKPWPPSASGSRRSDDASAQQLLPTVVPPPRLLARADQTTEAPWLPRVPYTLPECARQKPRASAEVRQYLESIGLGEWIKHLANHLPTNIRSAAAVRATTAADMRRMAAEANWALDEPTIEKALEALKRRPATTTAVRSGSAPAARAKEEAEPRRSQPDASAAAQKRALDFKMREKAKRRDRAAQEDAKRSTARSSRKISSRQGGSSSKSSKSTAVKKENRRDEVLPCGLTQRQLDEMLNRELTPEDYEILLKLDEQVAKPASRLCSAAQVSRFPLITIGASTSPEEEEDEQEAECGVCLCPLECGDKVRTLPCCARARFHEECITQWLVETKNSCPACLRVYPREE